jgi:hypothetical protein
LRPRKSVECFNPNAAPVLACMTAERDRADVADLWGRGWEVPRALQAELPLVLEADSIDRAAATMVAGTKLAGSSAHIRGSNKLVCGMLGLFSPTV